MKTGRATRSAPGAAASPSDGAAAAERLAGAGGWADARQAAIASAASAMAEGQGAALIASTGLARRLARTPSDGGAAILYWSSGWGKAAARFDPAVAAGSIGLESKIPSVLKDEAPGEKAPRRRRDAGR